MSKEVQSSQRVVMWLVEQVVSQTFAGETGTQRLQQVAVVMTIWGYQSRGEPLTAELISELYGMAPPQVSRLLKRLQERGIVERQRMPQTRGHGRGVMYALTVKRTKELRELLLELGLDHDVPTAVSPG